MKKSKCILTTLTATVFAMSVGALVACGDSSDGETKVGVYEITFDANGGAYANGNTVKLHTADGRILAEPTAPEYTGFVFTGYNVKQDGSGETVTFGANGYKFSGATTVYAQWEAQRQDGVYNITFDANGGTIVGNSVLKTTGGKLASLISETYLSYGGHTFDGWYTLKDGGDLVTVNYVFTGDATVYAHWTKDSGTEEPTGVYTVTFDPNGGTIANTTAQTLNGLLASLPTPTAPLNHTFDGWYTAATGGVRITATYEFTANTTIYAHYTKDTVENPDELERNAFYIAGEMTDWNILPSNKLIEMAVDPDSDMTAQYTVKFTTTKANSAVKLWYNDGSETGDWKKPVNAFFVDDVKISAEENGNYVIPEIGEYTLYYKAYSSGWIRIDVVKKIELPDPSAFTVKIGNVTLVSHSGEQGSAFLEYTNSDGIKLNAGASVSITVNGATEAVRIDSASKGIDTTSTEAVEKIVITSSGTFTFYVKYNGRTQKWELYTEFTESEPEEITPVDITFDANGGTLTGSATVKTDKYGRLTTLPVPTPPQGFKFVGWFTAATDGVKVTTATVFTEAATLYAVYDTAPLSPVFTLNTGNTDVTFTEYMATGIVVRNGEVIEFVIDGEKKEVSINGSRGLAQDEKTKVVTATRGGTFDFYVRNYKDNPAYWEVRASDGVDADAYYIVGNMGDSNWVWADKYKLAEDGKDNYGKPQYSITLQLEANDEVRIWMSENKWYNNLKGDADGKIKLVGDNMVVVESGLYKFWFNSQYEIYVEALVGEQTVTLDANGGTLTGGTTLKTDVSGKLSALPTPTAPQDKRFIGWFTASAGGDRVTTETVFAKATTIYAQYEDVSIPPTLYTITFDPHDGTLESGQETATTDELGKLAQLPTPTAPDGYEFIGWFTALHGGDEVTTEYTFTESKTVHALYEKIDTTPIIGMSVNGGDVVTVEYNSKADTESTNLVYEYVLIGTTLETDDVVTFVKDGSALDEFYNDGKSHGVIKEGSTFKVRSGGTFNVYVRYYDVDPETQSPACWVIEMTDGKTDELIENAYYFVGDGPGWKAVEGYDLDGETASITLNIGAGETFKIVKYEVKDGVGDLNWNESYGYTQIGEGKAYATADKDNNIVMNVAGKYTVTILANGKLKIHSDEVELPELPADPNAAFTYETVSGAGEVGYLVGKFAASGITEYAWGDGYRMTKVGDEYQLKDVYLSAGDSVKVRAGSAFASGVKDVYGGTGKNNVSTMGQNMDINVTGYYSFYWNPNKNNGQIWLEFTAAE